jgi:hypothetical protein
MCRATPGMMTKGRHEPAHDRETPLQIRGEPATSAPSTANIMPAAITVIAPREVRHSGPCAARQRQADLFEHATQQHGAARVPRGQAGELLSERRRGTRRLLAYQPADPQPDHDPLAADRDVGQAALVAAVHSPRGASARRAHALIATWTCRDTHAVGRPLDTLDHRTGQMRAIVHQGSEGNMPRIMTESVTPRRRVTECGPEPVLVSVSRERAVRPPGVSRGRSLACGSDFGRHPSAEPDRRDERGRPYDRPRTGQLPEGWRSG